MFNRISLAIAATLATAAVAMAQPAPPAPGPDAPGAGPMGNAPAAREGHHGMMRGHGGMHRGMMRQASKGAHFHFERDGSTVRIKCADDEPMRACVDAAGTLLDKLAPR